MKKGKGKNEEKTGGHRATAFKLGEPAAFYGSDSPTQEKEKGEDSLRHKRTPRNGGGGPKDQGSIPTQEKKQGARLRPLLVFWGEKKVGLCFKNQRKGCLHGGRSLPLEELMVLADHYQQGGKEFQRKK